jgi:hypothetical protein
MKYPARPNVNDVGLLRKAKSTQEGGPTYGDTVYRLYPGLELG